MGGQPFGSRRPLKIFCCYFFLLLTITQIYAPPLAVPYNFALHAERLSPDYARLKTCPSTDG